MSRVIFFIRPMYGHVYPTIELVKELARRGEKVIYYTIEEFQKIIESAGAACRFYADSGARLNIGAKIEVPGNETVNTLKGQVEKIFLKLSAHMEDVGNQEKELYAEIKAEKPDYIVYDYINAFWGKMLAQKLDVPAIASSSSFATCEELVDVDPVGCIKYVLYMSPHDPFFKNNPSMVKDLIDFISYRIESAYNIKNFNMLNFGNSQLLNIVYTSRYFQPYGEIFDHTFTFAGCSIGARPGDIDFPYEKLDKKPMIFISLGTNFNRRVDFYKECFEAFKTTDKQVVLSVGNRIDLAELGDIPGNFIIKRFVPQLEILKRAALFITHGGLNSVSEGIYYNVPLIVFPQQGDQFSVGHQVNRLGAGICFEKPGVTAGELRKAAEEIFSNEKFRENCRKIKESFEHAGGMKKVVDEIFKLKEKIGIQ
ncbi:MAG: glycosyl transferase family 1 [Candidatus Aminicenantes bacterium]|nr:MAG: glycosyl transferase family 1 [Candidatus Aminicenantes bacterium]